MLWLMWWQHKHCGIQGLLSAFAQHLVHWIRKLTLDVRKEVQTPFRAKTGTALRSREIKFIKKSKNCTLLCVTNCTI